MSDHLYQVTRSVPGGTVTLVFRCERPDDTRLLRDVLRVNDKEAADFKTAANGSAVIHRAADGSWRIHLDLYPRMMHQSPFVRLTA